MADKKRKTDFRSIKQWVSSPEGEQAMRDAVTTALQRTIDAEKEKKINHALALKVFC